jgi:hypothetical protein
MKGVPGTCTGPSNEVIIGRDDTVNDLHWWLGCDATGKATFQLRNTPGGTVAPITGGPAINDGNWHHLVAVRDRNAGLNRLYVDSVEVISASRAYTVDFDSTAAVNIGWLNLGSLFRYEGSVDEVALYSKALSPAEIAAHYNNGGVGIGYCGGPPNITSTPVTVAQVDQLYTYDVNATGDPAPTYTLTISQTGMTIDSLTGLISWTPTASQTGSFPVQVQAVNTEGVDTQDFTIQVFDGPIPIYLPIVLK